MDIKVRFDLSDLEQELKSLDDKVINKLVQTGEAAIQKAVKSGQYVNRTGNLRSSIGYVLAYNGKVIREGGFKKVAGFEPNMQRAKFTTKEGKDVDFWANGPSGDGTLGSEEGRKLATELATSAKNGYTMVVVAGMGYASYVNAKGLDVMDSAMIEIKELLKP